MNVGNPDEITMLQLAKEIVELTKSKSKIVFKDLPQDDPKIRQPDITVAKKVLGWSARVPRKEGLQKTMEYFRKELKIVNR
jgi:dTDP-glucose 4,6-dehydratase